MGTFCWVLGLAMDRVRSGEEFPGVVISGCVRMSKPQFCLGPGDEPGNFEGDEIMTGRRLSRDILPNESRDKR